MILTIGLVVILNTFVSAPKVIFISSLNNMKHPFEAGPAAASK